MKILVIGDVFGETGRRAISNVLPNLRQEKNIDFVIANAENVTDCKGLSFKHYEELMQSGVDFFTMGNHTWSHSDVYNLLKIKNNIIRPYNIVFDSEFSKYGVGTKIVYLNGKSIRITSLLGQSIRFKNLQLNPFNQLDEIIKHSDKTDFHIIDFHAESTSEKNALFYAFKGKVSAIVGTHTHVQTADDKIKENTAYITDIGLTGPTEGVIGANGDHIVNRLRNLTDQFILHEAKGLFQFCAVILELDEKSKIVNNIERIFIYEE